MKISEAWKLYEIDKKILGYSKHTMKGYKIQANLLIRNIGDKNIEDITLIDLKEYLIKASEHLKSTSVNHRQRFI